MVVASRLLVDPEEAGLDVLGERLGKEWWDGVAYLFVLAASAAGKPVMVWE
jgi:hypothetical protein